VERTLKPAKLSKILVQLLEKLNVFGQMRKIIAKRELVALH